MSNFFLTFLVEPSGVVGAAVDGMLEKNTGLRVKIGLTVVIRPLTVLARPLNVLTRTRNVQTRARVKFNPNPNLSRVVS